MARVLVIHIPVEAGPVFNNTCLRWFAEWTVANGPLASLATVGVPQLVPLLLPPPERCLHAIGAIEPKVLDAVVLDVLDDGRVHE